MLPGSRSPTPIHGFDEQLQPIRHTPSPNAAVTRRQAVQHDVRLLGLLEDRRRRGKPKGRSKSLEFGLINEDDDNTFFLEQLYKAESVESLAWDDHRSELSFEHDEEEWSRGTQFNVTIIETESSFHDAISSLEGNENPISPIAKVGEKSKNFSTSSDVIVTPLNSTENSEADINYTYIVNMDVIKMHRSAIREAEMIVEDDISIADPDVVTVDYLKIVMQTVLESKTKLQQAIAHLAENDADAYERSHKDLAMNTKKAMVDFIKRAQLHIRNLQDAAASVNINRDKTFEAATRIKANSVTNYQDKVTGDMEQLVEELKFLCTTDPNNDSQYHGMYERYVNLTKRTEAAQKDARALYKDAVDCGLEEPAVALEKYMRALKEAHAETDVKIHDTKEMFGIRGGTASKLVDVKPPEFKGDLYERMDYYSFREEFDKYIATKNISTSEKLRVLQQTCLQGGAQESCREFQTIDEVWDQLKQSYGNPTLIFNAKVEDIRKLGGCQGSHSKKRDWGITIISKLKNLQKVATQHEIEHDLYYCPLINEIRCALPAKAHSDFKKELEAVSEFGNIPKKVLFEKLLVFLDVFVRSETFDINFDYPEKGPEKPKVKPDYAAKPTKKAYNLDAEIQSNNTEPTGDGGKPTKYTKDSNQKTPRVQPTTPVAITCVHCSGEHTHLFYCEIFMAATVKDRYKLTAKAAACWRCLRLDSKIDFNDRQNWFRNHWNNCRTRFTCKAGNCEEKKANRQLHMTMCEWHIKKNKENEQEFIKTLNPSDLPKTGARFFFNSSLYSMALEDGDKSVLNIDSEGCIILPDVNEPPIYMMQNIGSESNPLLSFYDSGCMGAALSNRAYSILDTENVRPGPTTLNVAGGEEITIEYGEERFTLPLDGSKTRATITGLRLANITNRFPLWELQSAWDELNSAYKVENPSGEDLPRTEKSIGGRQVDLMIGIRYLKYYPQPLFTLPSGLTVYRALFQGVGGLQGVLGGVHKSWRRALESAQTLGYQAYLTAEYRAYSVECSTILFKDRLCSVEPVIVPNDVVIDGTEEVEVNCSFKHCSKHVSEDNWIVPDNWNLDCSIYSIRETDRLFREVESIGTEQEYRCVACRNCAKCRNGDTLEKVSLREELEQSLIESSVTLSIDERRLEAKLPFVEDYMEKLKPNRGMAEKVLSSQLRNIERNPEMREEVLRSHRKLEDKGHVAPLNSLSDGERRRMESTPGPGYVIPWRTVYKQGSISTPCRMVFDASARTSGGESLNAILAKGQNKLAKILHLLIRFRRRRHALTADVSMAYNGVKLAPEHYKFQQYLWKSELNPLSPTTTMIVKTLIYGVRSAGGQTMAGFEKLADHVLEHEPEHADGALVLKQDAYMDDIMSSTDSEEISIKIAGDLEYTLSLGSMGVKDFTFSGRKPSEKVSADGDNVGLIGYLWNPVEDNLRLDIKELYLGKPKRGKLPEPVKGDVGAALREKFTRRTLVGKTAGVYDPLGLTTPLTAKFKLDLHDLCFRKLDWDDSVPEQLLPVWVENLHVMQTLKTITFRRTIIPEDAANTDVELIISVDASQDIAIAAVHSRILRKDGTYYTQLMTAKSKLVSTATIPRAELKAAVMGSTLGHVVKQNLGSQFKSCVYVTDSTICLFWIQQDERPMQIAIRNSVIEIRRFTLPEQWYHVETHNNIADLGTRPAAINEIDETSSWQNGKNWMSLPREQFPIRTADQVVLSGEEKKLAATELKAPDIAGYSMSNLKSEVATRYSYSKYIVDPCIRSWPVSVRILGYLMRFVRKMKSRLPRFRGEPYPNPAQKAGEPVLNLTIVNKLKLVLTSEELVNAENYFFLKATLEVKQFSKLKEYKDHSFMKNKILYYSGRIIDGQEIISIANTMIDLDPLSFVKPIIDRYSPVGYSIMIYCHENIVNHRNATTTLRESRSLGYILSGRELANQVHEACVPCRRYKKRLLTAELGKLHETRLTIAPAFYNSQVDLMGPFSATCEHNHRSKVSVWGVVFKDPASGAVTIHVMAKYDTGSFILAYTRFATNHGHPAKLFIDEGGQLVKACKEMEFSVTDIIDTLDTKYKVGVDFATCPVGGHNVHGIVERSIKELKKIYKSVFGGLKLSITGYETAFSWIANELNCLPICLGSRYNNLDNLDLITPARLLFGRNNRRSPTGICRIAAPSKMIREMELVFESWWKVWKDEKIIDFIPQPRKWLEHGYEPKPGDLVVFLKQESDVSLGEQVWRLGRVTSVERSKDGVVRTVLIEYRNSGEATFRTTRRSVRRVAVLHKEGELELVEELNLASKNSNLCYILRNLRNRET